MLFLFRTTSSTLAAAAAAAGFLLSPSTTALRTTAVKRVRSSVSSLRMSSSSSSSSASFVDSLLKGKLYIPLEDAITVHGNENVTFLDGSWWIGAAGKGRTQFQEGPRIAGGAHFLDIDEVAETSPEKNPKQLPHMMPTDELFSRVMDAMNIQNDHHLIVYGQDKCPFVHRAWYQLSCYHPIVNTHLLSGSVLDWKTAGGPVDETPLETSFRVSDLDATKEIHYKVSDTERRTKAVVDIDAVKEIVAAAKQQSTTTLMVDARSGERFRGEVDEPRPGLKRGRMPGSRNVFFMNLLQSDNPVLLRDPTELRKVFEEANVPIDSSDVRLVATCGSGATACTIAAAMIACGRDPNTVAIYDGSWAEWGAEPDVPIVTGLVTDDE